MTFRSLPILTVWQRQSGLAPGIGLGRWLFHLFIRVYNPYTGSLGARIMTLDKGYAKTRLIERRAIRNHLNSVHAIALSNLGEFTSGIALLCTLDSDVRGIPVEIHSQYLIKARGVLTGESNIEIPSFADSCEHWVEASIRNADNEVVAIIKVLWKLERLHES